ncbi:MAG: DUF4118 domain-containing protein [Dehalococcoidia bacterium]|nr:DUF4118 domain-containing protein [Dehalococcoidia bacterium]
MVRPKASVTQSPVWGMAIVALVLGTLTAVLAPLLSEGQVTNVALLYLFVTLAAAALWGLRVGLGTAVIADLLVNFFFIPPLHRFTVQRAEHAVTLFLFLAFAVVGAAMLSRFRAQVIRANARNAETDVLLEVSRQLAREPNTRVAMDKLCGVIGRSLGARGCSIVLADPLEVVGATLDSVSAASPRRDEAAVVSEAIRSRQLVRLNGRGRPGASPAGAPMTFVPLAGTTPGVLRLVGPFTPPAGVESSKLLGALADEASLALDRVILAREAMRAEALERSEEMKSTLLSSVSHDLRSPLTAIKAAVSSLRDSTVAWSKGDTEAFLETIESQADRLSRTVGNLLEMSRLEAGVTVRFEAVEVGPLLEEVALATAAATVGRALTTASAPGLWVRADYALALQAITNLVENAAKYSTPGAPIAIEAASRPGRVSIRVSDKGPGIPVDDLPHIFEKFYRGSKIGTAKGSGLGLALVKAMVEACGGTVSVASSPAGSVFEVELTAARAPGQ